MVGILRQSLARRTTRRSKRLSSNEADALLGREDPSSSSRASLRVADQNNAVKSHNWRGDASSSAASAAHHQPPAVDVQQSAASRLGRRGSRTKSLIEPKDVESAIKQHYGKYTNIVLRFCFLDSPQILNPLISPWEIRLV